MRQIQATQITEAVRTMTIAANFTLEPEMVAALQKAYEQEESPLGKNILAQILKNAQLSSAEQIAYCQDTGYAVFFVQLGQAVEIVGGYLLEAINEGVRQGYREGFLRYSIVNDPLRRVNTKDNTPAFVNLELIPGDRLIIDFKAKGGGSENMSTVRMLKPSDGIEGIKKFVVEWVKQAGGNPCPPIVVGIGIGGNFEKCAQLAKKAVFRKLGTHHPDPFYARLENELLELVNKTGVGPQGVGGRITALEVHIETFPTHIASLPLAINIECHAFRHRQVIF